MNDKFLTSVFKEVFKNAIVVGTGIFVTYYANTIVKEADKKVKVKTPMGFIHLERR